MVNNCNLITLIAIIFPYSHCTVLLGNDTICACDTYDHLNMVFSSFSLLFFWNTLFCDTQNWSTQKMKNHEPRRMLGFTWTSLSTEWKLVTQLDWIIDRIAMTCWQCLFETWKENPRKFSSGNEGFFEIDFR